MTGLFGNYYVSPTATAVKRAWKLCGRSAREHALLRRHGLKLAYWPGGPNSECADLDWDWITGLEDKQIGELRVDEVIADQDNIRIIFFKANLVLPDDPRTDAGELMLRIWPITVFQKKA